MTVLPPFSNPLSSLIAQPLPPVRVPIRRALIIGIDYRYRKEGETENETPRLRCPHDDAERWMKQCINVYGFKRSDITLMLDRDNIPLDLRPTHKNILHQIPKLLDGVQAGDEIVFFYSGHSGQRDSNSTNEDDNKDEYIMPMDHEGMEVPDKLIKDNHLRNLLVDPLPVGVLLTAIFDSCHSGTLLDLPHYKCNQVYFPFMCRGERRSKTKKMANVRKDGVMFPDAEKENEDVDAAQQARCVRSATHDGSVRIRRFQRLNSSRVQSIDTVLERLAPDAKGKSFIRMTTRGASVKVATPEPSTLAPPAPAPSIPAPSTPAPRSGSMPRSRARLLPRSWRSLGSVTKEDALDVSFLPEMTRQTSPENVQACDGFCEKSAELDRLASVYSLAACGDEQITFDVKPKLGWSMTRTLIEILKKDPHPPWRKLIEDLGHALFARTETWQKRSASNRRKSRRGPWIDFNIPQLGAHHTVTDTELFMKAA